MNRRKKFGAELKRLEKERKAKKGVLEETGKLRVLDFPLTPEQQELLEIQNKMQKIKAFLAMPEMDMSTKKIMALRDTAKKELDAVVLRKGDVIKATPEENTLRRLWHALIEIKECKPKERSIFF